MIVSVPLLIAESAALGIGASSVIGILIFKVEAAHWMQVYGAVYGFLGHYYCLGEGADVSGF